MKAIELIKQAFLLVLGLFFAAAAGRYGAQLYQAHRSDVVVGIFAEHVEGLPAPLTLYGTAACGYCKAAREYLKSEKIPFNDVDIDNGSVSAHRYEKLGLKRVPVLVSARGLVEGFRPTDYDKMLAEVLAHK